VEQDPSSDAAHAQRDANCDHEQGEDDRLVGVILTRSSRRYQGDPHIIVQTADGSTYYIELDAKISENVFRELTPLRFHPTGTSRLLGSQRLRVACEPETMHLVGHLKWFDQVKRIGHIVFDGHDELWTSKKEHGFGFSCVDLKNKDFNFAQDMRVQVSSYTRPTPRASMAPSNTQPLTSSSQTSV
jgi:hypothetical protein